MPHPCRSRHSLFRSLAIPLVVIAFATLGRAILRSARVDAAGPSAASLTLDQTSAPDWTTAQRSPEAPTSPSDTGPPDTEPFYEVNTHRAISNVALRRPDCVVDTYLKNELLLTNGIFTSTSGGILATRLEEGAEHEDTETISRPRNHFYNPVTNGGLNDIFSGTSSLQWAYDNAGNQFDWRGARDAYYRSLTRPTQTERLNELANTFFALGHVIHLVEDLGQPQHTRNDAHITYFPGAPYEDYCHTNYGTAAAVGGLATAPLPSFTVMASPFSGIPDEFAAFWDTGQYTGQTAFAGFAATPGLAEFSNAYFLTDDTMFGTVRTVALRRPGTTPLVLRLTEALDNNSTAAKHRFAHPSIRNTNLASFYPTETRITLQREGEDETNPLHYVDLVMPGHTTTNLFMINNSGEIGFDATTYESYAQALIPQAVAYAAQLMNMFFSPIGLSDPTTGWDATEKKNTVEIRNDSDRDFADGTWHLFYDDANGNRTEVTDFDTSAYSGLAPGASFTAKWSELLCEGGWTYTLVFQGKIGNELNAVAGKTFAPAQEVWRGTYYVPSGDPLCIDVTNEVIAVFYRPTPPGYDIVGWLQFVGASDLFPVSGTCDGGSLVFGTSPDCGTFLSGTIVGSMLQDGQTCCWYCPLNPPPDGPWFCGTVSGMERTE